MLASFVTATSSRHSMQAGVSQGGIISPLLFSLYVNDMPAPSRHVEVGLYADTAIIATSRKLTLSVSYLETYLIKFQRLLTEWGIDRNVSKSSEIFFG